MYNKVAKLPYKRARYLAAAPFILGMAAPLAVLDVSIEIYHHVAFPLYGIPLNRRGEYIKIDRHKLSYLGLQDKIWCTYCGYANGLLPYATKIAADTEKYWCGVKHQKYEGHVPPHHGEFLEYGDEKAFDDFLNQSK